MQFVSIVIPVKEINDFIRESIPYIQQLNYDNFEVLIFPDVDSDESFLNARIISTGSIGPAEKRDLALEYARGDILAFLDDDAYPKPDWLSKALSHFDDVHVAAVGGPAVTPDSDNIWQKASGEVYSSWLASGEYTYRYKPGKLQEVEDYPSVNLLVRKDVFARVGGFNSNYYPGEDTKLCLDITNLGYKIIYDPEVLVWHHRREVFKPHLKQVANYALHRGNFAKTLPDTSRKPAYFVPSVFLLFIIFFPLLGHFSACFSILYVTTLVFYLALLLFNVSHIQSLPLALLTAVSIFTTHVTYGAYFLKGLFTKELKR